MSAVADFRAEASRRVLIKDGAYGTLIQAERLESADYCAGLDLLREARRHYLAWGATAKVGRMDRAHPPRERTAVESDGGRLPVTSSAIDLLGVLSASQALSSETSLERLHARVAAVLGAMTGATRVKVLLWSGTREEWLMPAHHGAGGMTAITEDDAPLSVLRYVRRTQEPLVVSDATRDDRFERDPYLSGLERCSLLAVPIVGRGALRAVLMSSLQPGSSVYSPAAWCSTDWW